MAQDTEAQVARIQELLKLALNGLNEYEETEFFNLALSRLGPLLEEREQTYCTYCGIVFKIDDEAGTKVTEHIQTCEVHPMRVVEQQLAASQEQVAMLGHLLAKACWYSIDDASDLCCQFCANHAPSNRSPKQHKDGCPVRPFEAIATSASHEEGK